MYSGSNALVEKWSAIAEYPRLLSADPGNCMRSLYVGFMNSAHAPSATSMVRLTTRCALGRRTMWIAERCHSRSVSGRRGAIHPRRPASTRTAGNSVTAARNATAIETASAGPTLVNAGSWVKIMPRNVTATVAADAPITLPMDVSAFCTAASESIPDRMYS